MAAAMIRVFQENGDRTDRKKARLKYLVDRWGMEKFIAETERRLPFPLVRFPFAECEPRAAVDRLATTLAGCGCGGATAPPAG